MNNKTQEFFDMDDFDFDSSEFGSDVQVDTDIAMNLSFAENDTLMLPVDKVHPDPHQPRKQRSEEEIERLRSTIQAKNGNDQAIKVRVHPELKGEYMIITGEGRWSACRELGIPKVKAEISKGELTSYSVLLDQMVENVGRNEMSLLDTSMGYLRLIKLAKERGEKLTQSDLSKMFGESQTKMNRMLKLAKADIEIQDLARNGLNNLNVLAYLTQIQDLSETDYLECIEQAKAGSVKEKELHKLIQTLKDEKKKQDNVDALAERSELIDDASDDSSSGEEINSGEKGSSDKKSDSSITEESFRSEKVVYDTSKSPSKLLHVNNEKVVIDVDGVEIVIKGEMLERIKEKIYQGGE